MCFIDASMQDEGSEIDHIEDLEKYSDLDGLLARGWVFVRWMITVLLTINTSYEGIFM